eukprot:437230-Pelagomonas_calceolata.AAC.3
MSLKNLEHLPLYAAEPTEQAQQQLLLPGQVQEQQEGPAVQLTFHASVRAPMSGHVVGWQGSETTHLQGDQTRGYEGIQWYGMPPVKGTGH